MASPSANSDVHALDVVRALIALSEHDPAFADRYLDRAATHLETLCSRERFQVLAQERAALARMTTTIRETADHGRWDVLKAVARQASALQVGLQDTEELVRVAADVHQARNFRPAATALALVGVGDLGRDVVEQARGATAERLQQLRRRDPAWGDFYGERAAWFQRLKPLGGPAVPDPGSRLDPAAARRRIAEAIEREAFGELEQLAEALGRDEATSQDPTPAALHVEMAELRLPFPPESVARAAALGLVMETLATDECGAEAAACRLRRRSEGAADHAHVCPVEIRPVLCDSLTFLSQHAVVSSAGHRYVPSFRAEEILVESFPEADPDVRTPLLEALGLPRRRGLARRDIEDALNRNTAAVCQRLGLDPFRFVVVCIPFDAYVRLAARRGWGREAMWTHLDGYQVGEGLELRALVGGDVRYGGCHDFCMVGRHYDGAHVTARFAIVRRSRLCGA